MCGRFTQNLTWRQIHDLYSLTEPSPPLTLQPRYNGAPAQDFPVCRLDEDGNCVLAQLRWGVVQSLSAGAWIETYRLERLRGEQS